MSRWDESLPNWWKTIDPRESFDYGALKQSALLFAGLAPVEQRVEVKEFSKRYCVSNFDQARASGLYVLLRVVFKVPEDYPREDVRFFGSWSRFGANDDEADRVNLRWPVKIEGGPPVLTVLRFDGYSGGVYDAVGEYNYFANRFKIRSMQEIAQMKFGETP
jgi:hypothetical protein